MLRCTRRQLSATAAQLVRRPILDRTATDPDTLQELDALPVPVLPGQLRAALRADLRAPLCTRTDWAQFGTPPPACPPRPHPSLDRTHSHQLNGDWHRAARLVQTALASWRNRATAQAPASTPTPAAHTIVRPARGIPDPAAFVQHVSDWIVAECALLQDEAATGSTARFEDPALLLHGLPLPSPAQRTALQPALTALARAPALHPAMKREILAHVLSVVQAAIK